jgi:hypothetical protein
MCDWRVAIETGSSLVVMRNRGLRLGCYSWYGNVPFRNVSALKGPQNVASGQRPMGTGPSAPAPTRRLTGLRAFRLRAATRSGWSVPQASDPPCGPERSVTDGLAGVYSRMGLFHRLTDSFFKEGCRFSCLTHANRVIQLSSIRSIC